MKKRSQNEKRKSIEKDSSGSYKKVRRCVYLVRWRDYYSGCFTSKRFSTWDAAISFVSRQPELKGTSFSIRKRTKNVFIKQ